MDREERRAEVEAACAAGGAAGFRCDDPLVLQQTNNVVVWLRPHPVVAKVGRWPHSAEVLSREVAVGEHLAATAAPAAEPIGPLRQSGPAGLPVSLWKRLEAIDGGPVPNRDLARALGTLHEELGSFAEPLPSFLWAIDLAQAALADDAVMRALDRGPLAELRGRVELWTAEARELETSSRRVLHGEPHLGNVVLTAAGPHFVDFESVCSGPLEWDLASMPAGVAAAAPGVDHAVLERLRLLNSARVAVWGWAHASDPAMRAHGEHHLGIVLSA
ncbi:MAG: phosphotransferase [Acidimicrobiales bacterium]